MNNNEIFDLQIRQLKNTFTELEMFYGILLQGKLNNTLTTDQKIMYELMDIMIPLKAAFGEACKEKIFPPYMVEKLHNAASNLNSVLEYFKSQGDDING